MDRVPLLFDTPVAYHIATPDMYDAPLFDGEATLDRAVPKRRREYAAGRAAARRALSKLGVSPTAILTLQDRTPKWPVGIVGSISHCAGCCVAVVARSSDAAGLGIDAEEASPLSSDVLRMVSAADEIASLAQCGYTDLEAGKVVFCAKEAFYKCYYPLTQTFLSFADVSIEFALARRGDVGSFSVQMRNAAKPALPTPKLTGRWVMTGGQILAGVTCRPIGDPKAPQER